MRKLRKDYRIYNCILVSLFIIFFWNKAFSNNINFEIEGNKFTDSQVIISLLSEIPDDVSSEYSNDIIKILNNSNLFSNIKVKFDNNKYVIIVKEYPNINKLYFKNNERLDDYELELIASEANLINLNSKSINLFINELNKIYESFGYNNVQIDYTKKIYEDMNTVDLYFDINEGKITKVNKILFYGNNKIATEDLKEIIKTKTKTIRNIFANNNFKPTTIERDKYSIINYYKNNGFLDIKIDLQIEYLKSNKVNIYLYISEGEIYNFSSVDLVDEDNILTSLVLEDINNEINIFLNSQTYFSVENAQNLREVISNLIIENGIDFFEIKSFEKTEDENVKIIFQILRIQPNYARQINIVGNSRTYDYVIRRELDIVEGDAIYPNQIENIRKKLTSLNLFENVNIRGEQVDQNNVDLIIEVKEKQTGTFNAGVSVGTLDGFSIVTGLRERNFYGTGRSLDALVNTSEGNNQFKLITTDRLSYENDADINYNINYRQQDFSKASSYKLDTFTTGIGIGYKMNKNLSHNIDFEYFLKDYRITDTSSVSNSILTSSGTNAGFLIKNNLRYSTLNPGFVSRVGNFVNFNNTIETPSSSNNGFVRNIVTLKKYLNNNNSIFSIQSKFGNIFSLNNNDILTDDKFALGGRWLRGFDIYGAGPRNSRTSYVGGNNIVAVKLDYNYEIIKDTNFPMYFNLFNDYGLLWDNKTTPTQNDNSLRSSAGFGIKYYSPIGPIGFSWGFPLMDEEYDINRMFLFSIGNLD